MSWMFAFALIIRAVDIAATLWGAGVVERLVVMMGKAARLDASLGGARLQPPPRYQFLRYLEAVQRRALAEVV